jgi:hypothetical protein
MDQTQLLVGGHVRGNLGDTVPAQQPVGGHQLPGEHHPHGLQGMIGAMVVGHDLGRVDQDD